MIYLSVLLSAVLALVSVSKYQLVSPWSNAIQFLIILFQASFPFLIQNLITSTFLPQVSLANTRLNAVTHSQRQPISLRSTDRDPEFVHEFRSLISAFSTFIISRAQKYLCVCVYVKKIQITI